MTNEQEFPHLHRHGEFSLLDGTGQAHSWAEQANKLSQPWLGISDHGTMAGVLHHIEACRKFDIKPIIGVEAYFRWDRLQQDVANRAYYHLLLLANNQKGYQNLLRLTSEAWRSGFYWKPCMDWSLLEKYREGIIASSACLSSQLSKLILAGDDTRARKWIQRMKKIFGHNFYLEIMPHNLDKQRLLNLAIIELGEETSTPVIATVDAHYPYKEWADTQDVLLMINTRQTVSSRKAKQETGEDVYTMSHIDSLYLMSRKEVEAEFAKHHPNIPSSEIESVIGNTIGLANSIREFIIDKADKVPKIKSHETAETILLRWCNAGLRRLSKKDNRAYTERLDFEIGILKDKHVTDYFVILGDTVRWAKEQGIRVGPGRGSAAGSLVSYLIGITTVDPIAHGLLFERFLNPARQGMPDIDVDFQHNRRHEVIDYLRKTWGNNHVVSVCAYQRFHMRSAIADTARVFGVPYIDSLAITKSLDDGGGDLKLSDVHRSSSKLKAFAKQYPDVWKHALRLEGQAKGLSKHPAGVVVTDKPVEEYMPLIRGKNGDILTAWDEQKDFRIISEYGFLKIDALATDSLSIQQHAVDLIQRIHKIKIDLDSISILTDRDSADADIMQLFAKGLTLGIFQFSSAPLTNLLKTMKPDSFKDLVAANALIRPGPLNSGFAQMYCDRKQGKEKVEYWHESVEPFLKDTYGLMIYQEQVMQIVQAIGGFSLAEADNIRRAITKHSSTLQDDNKGRQEMDAMKESFIEGAKKNGINAAEGTRIFDSIYSFANYGFNIAHSAAYSAQAYQDMWLKFHYPKEFYCAFASFESDKIAPAIREAKIQGIDFLPPHINKSGSYFTVEDKGIRYGFGAIKHLGSQAIGEIFDKGPYFSQQDFESKVEKRKVNSRTIEALYGSGAFDEFGARDSLTSEQKSDLEKQFLGFSFSSIANSAKYQDVIQKRTLTEEQFAELSEGDQCRIAGEIVSVREINTKKGSQMGFLTVSFGNDSHSVTVFPGQWAANSSIFQEGETIFVAGEKNTYKQPCVVGQYFTTLDNLVLDLKRTGKL